MKQLPRPVLITIFVVGLMVALWPVGEAVYGLWSQHSLRAKWSSAAAKYAATHKSTNDKSSPAKGSKKSKSKSQAKLVSVAASKTTGAYISHDVSPTKKAKPVKIAMQPRKKAVAARPKEDWPPMRLVIPDIGLDAIVADGIDKTALSQGPGHDPASTLPGEPGNCVIAGHRNMYGWWFYRLGQLGNNSTIELHSPTEIFTYKVAKTAVLKETDTWILRNPPPGAAPRLTLYTCTIPHSSKRIVVLANLVE